ncbi:MAG: helix-turn-helix domain-containing protein [Proteobacteria bacterium]|nr:helix-turn-helix domain-containing protein [Pseudomonadota bacterium]
MKLRRKELRISQEKLGHMVDVSYQQVQKYEKGTNQLNSEMLQKIAQALEVPLSFFFENAGRKPGSKSKGVPDRVKEESPAYQILEDLSPRERELIEYFREIEDEKFKACFLSLIKLASKRTI